MSSFVHKASSTTISLLILVSLEAVQATTDSTLQSLNGQTQTFIPNVRNDTYVPQISNEFEPSINAIINHLFQELIKSHEINTNEIEEYPGQEKIFLTSSGTTTTMLSFWGSVYSLIWLLAIGVVASMIICYWVGCEYESTAMASSYRSNSRISTYVIYSITN